MRSPTSWDAAPTDILDLEFLFQSVRSRSGAALLRAPRPGFVLEVEAGRAVINNQFLKDLFQACMMKVVEHLGIAVRNLYEGGNQRSKDFDRVVAFFDTLYSSNRLHLPLHSVVVIGY